MENKLNYQELVKKSFSFIWQNKFAWIFGFFIAGNSLPSFNFSMPGFDSQPPGDFQKPPLYELGKLLQWIQEHTALFSLLLLSAIVIYFIFVFLSFISEGALIGIVMEKEEGTTPSIKTGFKKGLSKFWPLFGIYWAVVLIVGVVFLILFLPLIYLIINSFGNGNILPQEIFGFMFVFLIILFVSLILFIPVGIIMMYARRFIVIDDKPVFSSLKSAYNFFINNFGKSLMIWFINTIIWSVFFAALLVMLLILILPFIFVIPVGSFFDLKAIQIIPIVTFIALIAIFIRILTGVMSSFTSALWTYAYLEIKRLQDLKDQTEEPAL